MSNLILACLEPWLAARGYLPKPGTPKSRTRKLPMKEVPQPSERRMPAGGITGYAFDSCRVYGLQASSCTVLLDVQPSRAELWPDSSPLDRPVRTA